MTHLLQKKNLLGLKLYIIKRKFNFCHEYAIYFISCSEKMFISFVASPLMKYAFFASLDEINAYSFQNLNILCNLVELHDVLYF